MMEHRPTNGGQAAVFDRGDSAVTVITRSRRQRCDQVSGNNEEGMHTSMHAPDPDNWRTRPAKTAILAALLIVGHTGVSRAQVATEAPPVVPGAAPVIVQHVRIHSEAIAGNLAGEPAARDVIVFLPADYYQAARNSRQLRDHQQLHDLSRYAYQCRSVSLPEPRAAVLQSHVVLREVPLGPASTV